MPPFEKAFAAHSLATQTDHSQYSSRLYLEDDEICEIFVFAYKTKIKNAKNRGVGMCQY